MNWLEKRRQAKLIRRSRQTMADMGIDTSHLTDEELMRKMIEISGILMEMWISIAVTIDQVVKAFSELGDAILKIIPGGEDDEGRDDSISDQEHHGI